MSASAEVYISVDNQDASKRDAFREWIEKKLHDIGMSTTDTTKYSHGTYLSGIIVECKGYSVSWDIFDQEWADSVVRGLHKIDDEVDVEIYVYNLDREADVVATTHRMRSQATGAANV
jgi:hypothetical protein